MSEQPFSTAVAKLRGPAAEHVEALLRAAVPETAPAVAVSIWSAGAPWYEASCGWVDPETRGSAVRFGTLFDLGTLTQVFTATAFLRLANDFKVDIDGSVAAVIPELARPGVGSGRFPDPATVTFRQLLAHTGGLAPRLADARTTGPAPLPPDQADPVPVEERWATVLTTVSDTAFASAPGEACLDSDIGYLLLGVAVARVFGQPQAVAMQALVRDRLGLDTLAYRPAAGGRPRALIAPTGVDTAWRGRRCWGEVEDMVAAEVGGVAGHAGLFATVHDVARFGVAWLRSDPRLRMERFFRTARTDQTGLGAGRGLGWAVQATSWLEPFGAGAYGQLGSTGTSLVVDPGRDLAVALLTNHSYHGGNDAGITSLRQDLHEAIAAAF